jgi:transposase-like protein
LKIPTIKDGIVARLSENKERDANNFPELALHVGNRFEMHNPRCPECDSYKVIKQEYYPRNLKLAEFGQQKMYVRRYLCKVCNKKFTTPIDVIVKKGHQYARIYQNQVKNIYKTGYNSFRHLKKIFLSMYGNSPSHQTIYEWIEEMKPEPTASESKYSGYYCYDEQYLRINGNRFYRLSLIDSILNKPISEEIFNNLEFNTIKSFIIKATANKPVHAITTDHRRKYKTIMDELKINHQLCIFHLFRMIGKEVYKKLNSKLTSNKDKIRLCVSFTRIKEIFRTYDLNIAIHRLEETLKISNDLPKILHKPIQKIIEDFNRLTLFMKDGFISRTTNPVENYYRNTIPDNLKRTFKTQKGTLNFLNARKEHWIENISKND